MSRFHMSHMCIYLQNQMSRMCLDSLNVSHVETRVECVNGLSARVCQPHNTLFTESNWKILHCLWIPDIDSLDGYYSINPSFTRITWNVASHGIYEITLDHYPLSSSLFQPCSSTSRTPSLHGIPGLSTTI